MKKLCVSVAALFLVATPAFARVHTATERDQTISVCKLMLQLSEPERKAALLKLQQSAMSNEDKDYVLDMCHAYIVGLRDGQSF